jgi:hypothetical protein
MMISRFFLRLLVLYVPLLAGVPLQAAQMATPNPYEEALLRWEATLQDHVDELGRIDFHGVAQAPEGLAAFVTAIAAVSPQTRPDLFTTRAHVIAYHINAYNAVAMQGVLERGIPDGFTSFFSRVSFFRLRGVVIGGEETNLYTYENEVIRGLHEPRIHFALNCMVKDCPRLPRAAFRPQTLEEQLETAAKEFFAGSKYLWVDAGNQTTMVSSILKFYTADFVASGKAKDLPSYINRYAPDPVPAEFKVKFIPYDWRINKQPR